MAVYRVNKNRGYTVMANYHLKDKTLSLKAVGLLSKMLSFNDGWQFSTKGLSAICKEGPDAVLAALRELEVHGYLIRHRQRDAKGRMSNTVFEIYEQPQPVSPHRENPDVDNPDMDNPHMENPHGENPAQLNTNRSNTNSEKTYPPNTQGENPYPSIHLKERQEDVAAIRDSVRSQIGYSCLVTPYNRDRMDEIVELMVEILCTTSPTLLISGEEYPIELVHERFQQINSLHIQYMFECLRNNASSIRNIKAYMLAVLFNAPSTLSAYYDAQVRHDRAW